MNIPALFMVRMKKYFANHPDLNQELFFASFDDIPWKGIRFNRLKVNSEDQGVLLQALDAVNNPVPWCSDGYYISDFPFGKDAYYYAGVYYIQEPSAMLPASILEVRPGDTVLDLCAAPGGKATRIGADLCGEGLLVANEISEDRSRALLRNIELFGIENVVITNETPQKLERHFPGYFDRILIDAPCSGEGMFRRDKSAVKSWERYGPPSSEIIQREILSSAHHMLKPGGNIVYSTCTFGTSENEDMIDWFLSTFPEYEVVSHPNIQGVSFSSGKHFAGAIRIWPQISRGDGHFCVHLRKAASASVRGMVQSVQQGKKTDPSKFFTVRAAKETLLSFAKDILTAEAYTDYEQIVETQFILQGDKIHLLPVPAALFDGLKVMKMGAFPGEVRMTSKGRIFNPSHSFALALSKKKVSASHSFSFSRNDERLHRYLRGETVLLSSEEGQVLAHNAYILIFVDSYPIGWGKSNGDTIKNHYPKAWRLQ